MKQTSKRLLSLLLVLMLVVSALPVTAFAADEESFALVTDVAGLAAGDRVIIVAKDYDYALGTNQKTNNREAVSITKGDTITPTATTQVLTLQAGKKENTWAFNDGNGYLFAAGQSKAQGASSNQNYLRTETTLTDNSSWAISIASDGTASVVAQGDNGCNVMQYNTSKLFASYSSASQKAICLYKQTGGTAPDPEPDPEPEEPVVVPISDALAGEDGAAFTVKGVVTLVDGNNIYVQDSTGGICVRMSSKPTDISLGDTIIGTGTKAVYNGLPQLGSGTYEKSSGLTLTAKETTIGALTTADVCTYVKLSGVEITEVYDNN